MFCGSFQAVAERCTSEQTCASAVLLRNCKRFASEQTQASAVLSSRLQSALQASTLVHHLQRWLWALSGNCDKRESKVLCPGKTLGSFRYLLTHLSRQIFYVHLLQGRLRRLRSRRPRRRSRGFWRLSAPGGGWTAGPRSAAPRSPSSPASASGDRRRPPQVTHPD
jgi:hypothetical protein